MTAVVHSLHERQALDWAIRFFRDLAHQPTAEGSKKKFHDTFTRVLLDVHYVYDYTREERGEIYTQLVDEALDEARHGNPFAVQQLSKFAAALIEKGEPLPEEIRGAVAELLRNPPKVKNKRGPGPFTLMARDSAIIEALTHINETWKFPITRNHYSKGPSAASIVHDAIHSAIPINLTERGINSIWTRATRRSIKES
jgi:hypothetical protein